jgi:hypothetical protein
MSDDREEQSKSPLEDLQPFAWSDEQSVSYEVALELISQVVAGYEALIDREESKDSPDADALQKWNVAEDHYIAQREALRLDDAEGIERLRAECVELIRKIRDAL